MSEQLRGAPPAVTESLGRLKDQLSAAAGPNLAGLIVYGGLARGRYRPGKSDVNVVILLHDASAAALTAIAPAVQHARRAVGVDPLILTPAEVPRAAAEFPTKFVDIRNYHVVLFGSDPFAALEVTREQIRSRTEQELRNLLLRLRHHYVIVGSDAAQLTRTLAGTARPLALSLESLLTLAGSELPADDRTAAVFRVASTVFQLDGVALDRLAGLRHDLRSVSDLSTLVTSVLDVLGKVLETACRMKESLG